MKTVPNQKIIVVSKETCSKQNPYCVINLEAMRSASKALKAGGFQLWCYFAMNQNGYTFAASNAAAYEAMGIKRDAYNRAIQELIGAGYLVCETGNRYTFFEKPVEADPIAPVAVVSSSPLQEIPSRNNTETIHNNNIEQQEKPLPEISMKKVLEIGCIGYVIDGGTITFSTGKKYRLIQ